MFEGLTKWANEEARRRERAQRRRIIAWSAVAGILLAVIGGASWALARENESDKRFANHVERTRGIALKGDEELRAAARAHREGALGWDATHAAFAEARSNLASAFTFTVLNARLYPGPLEEERNALRFALASRGAFLDEFETCTMDARNAYACAEAEVLDEQVDDVFELLMK